MRFSFIKYILCVTVVLFLAGFEKVAINDKPPVFIMRDTQWTDSVLASLTPDERIAQLFMVAAYSNKDKEHVKEIKKLVTDYKIGGLIFFQGGPLRQAQLTNQYQSLSKVPLLISIDGEWGLAMRLDSTIQYPRQMTLGAIQDDSLIYKMGAEIARQCRRMGIHVNFAPVVDVNNNPRNPVISNRSFGENKYNVARKGAAYMKGMQDNGVLANAKHFPGHGDTDSDSHKTLPIISYSRERIDSLELYPFKELFRQGLASVMVAHLYIPALDSAPNQASTLSQNIVTGLLKDSLGFKGLIFTDALNMKGVSKFYPPGMVDVKAVLAGNDVLLFAEDVPVAINEIKKAIEKGEITQEEIDARCRKILLAKQWAGLNNYKPVELKNLYNDLNTPQAELINRKLAEASLTLLVNKDSLLPLRESDTLKIATLNIGYSEPNIFQQNISLYAAADHYGLKREALKNEIDTVLGKLRNYNLVIVNINNTNNSPGKNFGLAPWAMEAISRLKEKSKVVVNIPANPYILEKMNGLEQMDAVIMSYEDINFNSAYAAQAIFGGAAFSGRLPVSASPAFTLGSGMDTKKIRFKHTIPEDVNISSRDLEKIDSIAKQGIYDRAYPGCQVLVAKSGNVIYHKAFGYHTYENSKPVKLTDMYDVASITKIAATLPSLMKLTDEGKINIDGTLGAYMPELKGTNKESLKLREILAHQAGLRDWIPFFLATINKGIYKEGVYSTIPIETHPFRVANGLYIHKDYPDTMWQRIIDSPVNPAPKYLYSDLGYYFFKEIIERVTGTPLEKYTEQNFYRPLGMATTTYRPLERFPAEKIIPTEYDITFRKQLIHGDVHDQGAAMFGGVGGHAGLFSNANDLAKLMQMYLQGGEYGEEKYLNQETIEEFTKRQFCEADNRRGAGFDKPEPDPLKEGPACRSASLFSFGHSGFTGTIAWADPEQELIYIFLSNRVYPDADNKKLIRSGTRTKIQQVIYDAIKE